MSTPEPIDCLILNAAQVVACAADRPQRGAALRDPQIIPHGAVAIHADRIVAVGPQVDLLARYQARQQVDAAGGVICPGFVDPHTHAIYAGDRVAEFEQRLAGATYLEIMAAGGGIASTMRATRAADLDQLIAQTRQRLDIMLALGTTTIEIKTGYGLSLEHELRLLEAIEQLAQQHPATIVPTFLGAHALPPEYREQREAYLDLVVEQMIPAVDRWYRHSWFARSQPQIPLFIDIFCEQSAFQVAELERVLAAGQAYGMRPKAHVDQFTSLGGVAAALRLGAASVDHLEVTSAADIALLAESDTIGVVIPAANVNLGLNHHAPARQMIDAGVALALCSDLNPGSAPCYSMPLVMGLACRYMKILPAEALIAATLNAAYAIGLGAQVGSLQPGKQADLLIIQAPDYRHLAYYLGGNPVRQVIKAGQSMATLG
ncbi:MAG: imidazolonepropionase [Roseiflexaceae bacterium]